MEVGSGPSATGNDGASGPANAQGSSNANNNIDPSIDPKRKAKSNDPGWKYAYWPDLADKNMVRCTLCKKDVKGGIKRMKQHLVGGYGDVAKCLKTTAAIAREMQEAIMRNKKRKLDDFDDFDPDEVNQVMHSEDEIEEQQLPSGQLQPPSSSRPPLPTRSFEGSTKVIHTPSSGTASKRSKTSIHTQVRVKAKGPMDAHLRRKPEDVVAQRHARGPNQTTIENRFKGEAERKNTNMYIARWMYERGIPFNAANCRSFEEMVEAIGQFGSGLKPPTYHELRVSLLKEVKEETETLRKTYEADWKFYGCTLMSDGWTDKRGRHLINFLVNSPAGTYFLGSVDASAEVHDANMLFKLIDSKVQEIGQDNVVQAISDNAANYVAAGRLLMEKRSTLYWTPCAAHCLNLMLNDIGNLSLYKTQIKKAKRVTSFIYRHTRLLEAMRAKLGGRDLVRPAETRFATSFLTLNSLYKHRDGLRQLFVSDDWKNSKLAATEVGKKVAATVISTTFWNGVTDCLRASQPILIVLRLVDADEKPAMAEVYVAMQMARNKIKTNFNDRKRKWETIIDIVDSRWECQMDRPLYAAACYLNPGKYFEYRINENISQQEVCKIYASFRQVLLRHVRDGNLQDTIMKQAEQYQTCQGMFSSEMAIRQRKTMTPILWWKMNGVETPELMQFALRIVSLCCSLSGCERNWSTFEQIHTKRRNRLEHQRLNDLVYVQYNRRLKARYNRRVGQGKDNDPLVLDELDWTSEWMTGQSDDELVHEGDDLTWQDVDRAVGASASLQGRNLQRRSAIHYERRGRGRAIAEQPSDSDEAEAEDEDVNVNDDEDVEDDFGLRGTEDSSGRQQQDQLDDFVDEY